LGSFDARLLSPARRFLESAAPEVQKEVARIIEQLLCFDPYIDNKTKISFAVPPAILALYSDGTYWVLYRISRNTEIIIWNIGLASDKVRL